MFFPPATCGNTVKKSLAKQEQRNKQVNNQTYKWLLLHKKEDKQIQSSWIGPERKAEKKRKRDRKGVMSDTRPASTRDWYILTLLSSSSYHDIRTTCH